MLASDSKKLKLLRYKGLIMVLVGAPLWGLSGTVAQRLFQDEGFTPGWLVTMRLLVSGILLITGCLRKSFHQVFAVWNDPKDRIRLVIFGIIGMLGVQYTYFVAIQTGNAATATAISGSIIYYGLLSNKVQSNSELSRVYSPGICPVRYIPSRNKWIYSTVVGLQRINSMGIEFCNCTCILYLISIRFATALGF